MRTNICIILLSLLSVSLAWTDLEYQEVFDTFNENYGYSFKSGDEYNKAFENFKTNLQDSASLSTDDVEHDITPYSYMTQAEQIAMLTGAVAPAAAAAALTEGAIAGIVVGCVGAAGLAVGGVFLGLHLKKKKEEAEQNAGSKQQTTTDSPATTSKKPVQGVDIYPSIDGRHQSITARAPAIKKTPQ